MTETEQMKVLFVGGRDENLAAFEKLLKNPVLNLVKTTSGKSALTLMLEHDFALVIIDVQMPDINGFETAELLRGHTATKHIPIIFVTAINQEQKHVFKGHKAGAVDYLFKPLDPDILQSKVKVFLELHGHKKALEKTNKQLQQADLKIQNQQETVLDQERLKGLLQTAGAVVHELNQPLQSISGYSDLIIMDLDEGNPFYERMHKIRLQVDKMAQISRKLMSIARYETKDHFKGKIIDIDKASKDLPVDTLSKLISETGS